MPKQGKQTDSRVCFNEGGSSRRVHPAASIESSPPDLQQVSGASYGTPFAGRDYWGTRGAHQIHPVPTLPPRDGDHGVMV